MNSMYPYRHYFVTGLLFIAITVLSQIFRRELEMINITLIHLLPVIVIALRGNMAASMIVTTFSVAMLALFYIPPKFSFLVHDLFYIWSFIIFYLVGYIITVQAQKIHANGIKETLFSTLSHDLKTPLSSIMGNATFLLQEDLDEHVRHDALIQIKDSSQRMNRLISNLLDSARLQNTNGVLQKEWCDLEELIGVALQEFRNHPFQDLLETNIDPELPLFWGDSALLVRLLVNLMDNALKYSDEGKPVRITITSTPKEFSILFFNECQPIKKADLKNMFDKFYRLENTADIVGSGIGLSICKEIAIAHQGNIEAYNVEGGVSIEVILPVIVPSNAPKVRLL